MPSIDFNPPALVAEPDLLLALRRYEFPVDCLEDRVLFCQGEEPTGLYVFHGGVATMVLESADGTPLAAVPVRPGALLGLQALVGGERFSTTAVAKAGAQVGFVTHNAFLALMLSKPIPALMMLRDLAAVVRVTRPAFWERRTRTHRGHTLRRKRSWLGFRIQAAD
jgi:CRP-like cAMP-binding protein